MNSSTSGPAFVPAGFFSGWMNRRGGTALFGLRMPVSRSALGIFIFRSSSSRRLEIARKQGYVVQGHSPQSSHPASTVSDRSTVSLCRHDAAASSVQSSIPYLARVRHQQRTLKASIVCHSTDEVEFRSAPLVAQSPYGFNAIVFVTLAFLAASVEWAMFCSCPDNG